MAEAGSPSAVAQAIAKILAPAVGRFTAERAVALVARSVKVEPEDVGKEHVEDIGRRLEPMLRTLVGRTIARELVDEIRRTGE